VTVAGRRTVPVAGRGSCAAARRLAALLVAFLAAGLLTASVASGHATVLETVPANGATLDRAPARVELTFNEAVEARFGAFRVLDARGDRVDDGTIVRPTRQRIGVGLRPDLPDGSYAATYRVVSADGHPVTGGISFVIGAPSAGGTVDVARLVTDAEQGAPAGIGPALAVARAVRYAGIAAVVGFVAFLLVAWRPVRGVPEAADVVGPAADRWARAAALLGAIGVAATFVLQGATVAGTGVLPALSPAAWGDVAQTRTGLWLLVALGLLLVLAGLLPRVGGALRAGRVTPATVTVVALTGLLAATPALGGHAAASHPAGVMVVLQTVHVAAIGAWLGGLLLLGRLLRVVSVTGGPGTDRAATTSAGSSDGATASTATVDAARPTHLRVALLDGFGPLAITAVLALIVAGVVLSVVQLTAVGDLVDSAYGRAILLKALLTFAAVAVAVVQRRRIAPRVAAARNGGATPAHAGETTAGGDSDAADRTVRRLLAGEIALLVAVLAVTGALAGYGQPGRRASTAASPEAVASASPAATTSEPLVREVTVDGRRLLRLELDPGVAGANDLTVRAVGIDGRPDRQGRDARLRLSGPGGQTLDPPLRRASRGRWIARGVVLAPAGPWTARLQLRTSAFDEDDVTFEVPLR
jgi:copper transport protein